MDDGRWRRRIRSDPPRRAEPTRLRLAVRQDVGAGTLNALVGRIGPELVEEDDLPDRAAVLGGVSRPWLLPVAVGLLGGEQGGDRVGRHRRAPGRSDLGVIGAALCPRASRTALLQTEEHQGSGRRAGARRTVDAAGGACRAVIPR